MKKITKHLVILLVLIVGITEVSNAQFDLSNGEFFQWQGDYTYTSVDDEKYELNVWGSEGTLEGILSYDDGIFEYKIDCWVEYGEDFKSIIVKYTSINDGFCLEEDDLEEAMTNMGSFPEMFILSMENDVIMTESMGMGFELYGVKVGEIKEAFIKIE